LKLLAASSESANGGFDPMEFFILCSLGFKVFELQFEINTCSINNNVILKQFRS
jgi:hypothetical protein